jgi:integrase
MADDRKLVKTKHPGVYSRGDTYVVRWKYRGRSHKRYFHTLALAREFKGSLDSGQRQAPTRQTVADYYAGWIVSYRGRTARGLEDTTRDEYRRSFEAHVLPLLGGLRLRDLGSRDVSDWFGDLEGRGVQPPSIRKAKAALSAMVATAAQDGDIAANPVLGVRYVPSPGLVRTKRKRRPLTVADVEAILGALEAPWRLFFELLAHSGLRIGELLGLTWQNVHLGDDPHVLIVEQVYRGRRKRLKTEGSERRLPLSPGMALALTDWKAATRHEGADRPVFPSTRGTPLTYSNVYNRVLHPALQTCGLAVPLGKDERGRDKWDYQGISFHSFRKALGSILLLRAGKTPKQVQGWLGHSQLTTTMNIYTHELDDGLGGADDLDAILGATGGHPGATEHPPTAANGNGAEATDSALESGIGEQPQPTGSSGTDS